MFGIDATFSDNIAWQELSLITGLNLPFSASNSTPDPSNPVRGPRSANFCASGMAFTQLLEDRAGTERLGQEFGQREGSEPVSVASGMTSENILFPKLQRQALNASGACPQRERAPQIQRGGTAGQEGPVARGQAERQG